MAKKDRAVKLPRRVGEVKIPKSVRKGALAEFLGSKVGQALVAEAVMAAAGMAIAHEAKAGSATRRTAKKAKDAVQDALGETPTFASVAPATLAYAFSEAGHAFAEALKAKPAATAKPAASAKSRAAAKDSPDADWPADFAETPKPARKRAKPAAAKATTGALPH